MNQNNSNSNWKKLLGFRNMQENLEKLETYATSDIIIFGIFSHLDLVHFLFHIFCLNMLDCTRPSARISRAAPSLKIFRKIYKLQIPTHTACIDFQMAKNKPLLICPSRCSRDSRQFFIFAKMALLNPCMKFRIFFRPNVFF